jgi:hypothetical protein
MAGRRNLGISQRIGVSTASCELCRRPSMVSVGHYHQNIGLVLSRRELATVGAFCRECHTVLFWRRTAVTAALGWWGLFSFYLNPFYIAMNVRSVVVSRRLPRTPKDASTKGRWCVRCRADLKDASGPPGVLVAAAVVGAFLLFVGILGLIQTLVGPFSSGRMSIGLVCIVLGASAVAGTVVSLREPHLCVSCTDGRNQ